MTEDFKKLFYPQSVAVVGASEEPESVGYGVCVNLRTFTQPVYYINPNHTSLFGKTCYKSLTSVTAPVDLAIIAVPAHTVPAVVEEAGRKGIKCLIIISAGFKESSPEGAALENSVRQVCLKYGITMIGPNCLGVLHPEYHLNASFASTMPSSGPIAFISQSGALCSSVIDYSRDLGIGFSTFVSIGNKTCVDEISLIRYLSHDAETYAIFLYVEDIHNPAEFVKVAYDVTHGKNAKPIVMLKGGRTEAGAKASVSHTGALGGNDAYYDALARQAGIVRVHSISEFFNLALVISHNPKPTGNRTAIITNAGGPGILMTDEAVEMGLATGVPMDLLGDAKADQYRKALDTIEKDMTVDSTLILLTPQAGTEIDVTAKAIADASVKKPTVVSFMGKDKVLPGIQILREAGVSVTEYPEDAARALGQYTQFALESNKIRTDFSFPEQSHSAHLPTDSAFVPEEVSFGMLKQYGFPVLPAYLATSAEETVSAVKRIGSACAVKVNSPDITHKTDVGGVVLNVTETGALDAYEKIIDSVKAKVPNAVLNGVTVVEMAPMGGTELIIGFTRKANFGTVVMVGMGGTFVEIMKDVSFGIAPLTKSDAVGMITALRFSPVFSGFRGRPPLDTDILVDCLGRVSQIAMDMPEISELDINPFILYPKGQGAKVVDVRIILTR